MNQNNPNTAPYTPYHLTWVKRQLQKSEGGAHKNYLQHLAGGGAPLPTATHILPAYNTVTT